jgi:hypothetical protein
LEPVPLMVTERLVAMRPTLLFLRMSRLSRTDRKVRRRRMRCRFVARLDVHQPERESPDATREAAAGRERHDASLVEADAAAVEQHRRVARRLSGVHGRRRQRQRGPGFSRKEIPLLRKEQAEPRQVDLLLVGFDLARSRCCT